MKVANRAGRQFAICVRNRGYRASLELRKLYEAVPDHAAAAQQQIRIIDESGEDYLYPEDCFVLVRFPQKVKAGLALVS